MSEEEIFIILEEKPEIQVFDCVTLEPLRIIKVPALKNLWDITFSEDILFVATYSPGLIYRIPLNSSESLNGKTSWSIDTRQSALSTLKSGNILATGYSSSKLVEYTTTGELVQEITLQQGTYPTYAVQLDSGRLLVCHVGNLHGVCLIDNIGQLIKSFGGAPGSGPGRLTTPYHMVADVNGFCLVVEFGGTNRVILLDDNLQFVKELIPQSIGLKRPIRLYLDRNRKKLLVADYNNKRVVVFDVLP